MKSRLEQITSQNVKQTKDLFFLPQMQQALHLLQLPVLELSTVIEEEMTQNPLLECDDFREENLEFLRQIEETPSYSKRAERGEEEDLQAFIENTLSEESSLFEHVLQQAKRPLSEKRISNLPLFDWKSRRKWHSRHLFRRDRAFIQCFP